jgi:uncharacterized protein
MEIMMALGAFRFSLDTAAYQQLTRETSYSLPEHARTGKEPILQFTGKGSDTISLQGTILPGFKGGTGQVSQMRIQADLGIPLTLISGTGNFFGLWYVQSISEQQEIFWPDGSFRKQGFTVDLKKYGELTISVGGFSVSASGLLGAIL